MSELPVLSGKTIIRVLEKLGFRTIRTKGSHWILEHNDGRKTVVPAHRNRDIARPFLAKILRLAEIDHSTFIDAWKG